MDGDAPPSHHHHSRAARGEKLAKRYTDRWTSQSFVSALLLACSLPNLLDPNDFWSSDPRWGAAGSQWFSALYGALWGGASLCALLTILSNMVLTNVINSAAPEDVEAVLDKLGSLHMAAAQCGRTRRVPVVTTVIEVLLAVVVLGTSWRPMVLQTPAVFWRPCLLYFFLATSYGVWFSVPSGFPAHLALMVVGGVVVVGPMVTAHAVVARHGKGEGEGESLLGSG